MAKPITIGENYFKSKKASHEHYQNILDRGREKTFGTPLPDQDQKDLLAYLLEYHPAGDIKIGAGVKYFCVDRNWKDPHKPGLSTCIHAVWEDGTKVPFSLKPLKYTPSSRAIFLEGLRLVVADFIRNHKQHYFDENGDENGAPCELTGEIRQYHEMDVDHVPPASFANIAGSFIQKHGLETNEDFRDLIKPRTGALDCGTKLLEHIEEGFFEYHRLLVEGNLRVICKNAHKKLTYGWDE